MKDKKALLVKAKGGNDEYETGHASEWVDVVVSSFLSAQKERDTRRA